MPLRRGLALAVLAALALGCDRKIEPFVPGEKAEPPDLSRIFPEGAEKAAKEEAKSAPPAPMGGRGAPPVAASASSNKPITGTVSIAPELAGRIPPGAVLFLIARTGDSGPPLAVKRIPDPKLPLAFSIGPDDRMIQAMPFAGPIKLSARIDSDGNAMTRLPGDLAGAAPEPHQPGDSGVAVVIDQVL
jgi:cytochrome c-type biogenesis protein CcmH